MALQGEAIDLTLSDEDDVESPVTQHQTQQLQMPIKCESNVAAAGNNNSIARSHDEDEGLQPATTGGIGLWSLWTRNFQSTLLMLLDLVDNSLDASCIQKDTTNFASAAEEEATINSFTGRVQIYRDLYEVIPGQTYTTGLCIRNNSPAKITPLKEVLKLFISDKSDSGKDTVGENGVGLKQSCAALSDLSFVLVKNGKKTLELGIIAKVLQKEEECFLPNFEFKVEDDKSVGQQIMDIMCKPAYKQVADCIAEYGRVRSGGNPSLARGVSRLAKHFENLSTKFYDNEYAFEVVVDKVVQKGGTKIASNKNSAVSDVIKVLQNEVPRRYLHIPDSLHFTVGKKRLKFKHWQERLVEFARVEIPVRSQTPWERDFGDITDDSYILRVYIGFDRYRISTPSVGPIKSKKALSLYIYSRSSGRMITFEPDARNTLGFVGGSTDYCQALTVIVDDIEGKLPLDPTKQGIAFGNQVDGHVHEENLYAVVHAVVLFYYQYHLKKFDKKKGLLTEKIQEFSEADFPDNHELKTCENLKLTDYGVNFILNVHNQIRVDHTCYKDEIVGKDTIFRLLPDESKPSKRKAIKGKATKATKATASSPVKTPTRKKKGASAVTPSPAKMKQPPVTKSRKSPPKRKTSAVAKNSKPSAQKKQKKQCTEASSPTQQKGSRSSSRTPSRPQRFGDYTEESENEPDIDNDDMTDNAADKTGDKDLIDLCSSSDDEEGGLMNKEAHTSHSAADESFQDNNTTVKEEEASVTVANALVNEIKGLKTENIDLKARVIALEKEKGLKPENVDLKARVIALEKENDCLKKEVKRLSEEKKKTSSKSVNDMAPCNL